MTRRRKAPDARQLVRFIADYESLALTCDEFPGLSEERIREMLRELAEPPELAINRARAANAAKAKSAAAGPKVQLFADGASRGNPGPAGAGWALIGEGNEVLREGCVFLGRRTNNEAEYEAVIRGLRDATLLGASAVSLRSDSQLLVRQLNGQYRVKSPRLEGLHRQARELLQSFRSVDVRHVPREQNAHADKLANRGIDEAMAKPQVRAAASRRR